MREHNPLVWLTDRATDRRGRWVMLGIWLTAIVALTFTAPRLANLYDNNATGSIGDQESVRASQLIAAAFPGQNAVPALIVLNAPRGFSDAQNTLAQQISGCLAATSRGGSGSNCLTANLSPAHDFANSQQDYQSCLNMWQGTSSPISGVVSVFTVPSAASQLISEDGQAMQMVVALNRSASDPAFSSCLMQTISTYLRPFDGQQGMAVKVSGPAGVIADAVKVFASTDLPLLLGTVGLVLILLLVIYRAPILALIPLVAVGWALQIVNGLLGFAAQAKLFAINQQATAIMTVLLFGVGTDYCIFIATRYREELQREPDRDQALRATMRAVGEAIASSAGTVILGLLTLVLTTLGLYKTLGPILAIAVAVMLLAGLTLIPALLSVIGRVAFWPFIPQFDAARALRDERVPQLSGFWGRIATFVARRPGFALSVSAVILAILAVGYAGTPEVFNFLTGFRSPTGSAAGYKILSQHFSPGTLAPFTIVIQRSGAMPYQHLADIETISQAVAQVPHVAAVSGPTRLTGTPPVIDLAKLQAGLSQIPASVTQAIRAGNGPAVPPVCGAPNSPPDCKPTGDPTLDPNFYPGYYAQTVQWISNDNNTMLLQVTLDTDPYGIAALDTIAPVRAAVERAIAGTNFAGATVALGGVTPTLADTRAVSDRDTAIVVPLVLVLVAIILGLLLRSIVAPIYLLVAVTVNYFAALGLTSFIVYRLQHDDGLAYATPLYTFIFLVALGADYTIFLMSRVREEAGNRGLLVGTQVALARTGGVITSAGLILAGTFLVLTTLPLRDLYQFGIAVALGVLLDTFIVRGLLVPGAVLLLGHWNWWPGKIKEPPEQDTAHTEEVPIVMG